MCPTAVRCCCGSASTNPQPGASRGRSAPPSTASLRGPEIEKLIGLPPGGGLDGLILSDPDEPYGTVQLSQYSGALSSENRYPRARPPARGMLSLTFFVPDLPPWRELAGMGEITDLGRGAGSYGPGRMATFSTPAGLRVDVVEQAASQWSAFPRGLH